MRRFIPLVILAGVTIAACGGKKPETTAAPQPNADSLAAIQRAHDDSLRAAQAADAARAEEERLAQQRRADSLAALAGSSDIVKQTLGEMIHFEFDRAAVRSDDVPVLDRKVQILIANPDARIQIVGNCDERGSTEYNLALGYRRATAAKQYLVNHGAQADRVETKSLGEERPIDSGHSAAAWATNRNDQFFVVTDTPLRQP